MLIKIIPPPAFQHQGGWDEMLMFLIPALLLTWLRNKQKNENINKKGIDAFKNIFFHMFKNVKEPKFFILDYSINKQRVFLKWKMTFFAFKSLYLK